MRIILIFLLSAGGIAQDTLSTTRFHDDSRSDFIKLDFLDVSLQKKSDLMGRDQAFSFIQQHHQRYGLPEDLSHLNYSHVQHSLLGKHYHFTQSLYGFPVYGAEIIVSISKKDRVFMVYNNTYPVEGTAQKQCDMLAIDHNEAFDIAWQDLRVHGDLLYEPSSDLVFYPEDGQLKLVYLVQLATKSPFGYWEHRIDATTGTLVQVRQTVISRRPMNMNYHEYTGPVWDRLETFSAFNNKEKSQPAVGKMANGTGVVFDPDPVTTLQDDTLHDNSDPSMFTAAYFTRNLLDITESGGQYSLSGPWVSISDFDPPSTAPSTTNNGNWTAVRGDNAFNDALTYFQLDQSQRYIQSMGFSGATGIQYGPISADSDGANGDDNSFYSPNSNTLSFGHGCVDDSEDTFVILHEYGHAIQTSIIPNFFGGDTGAIGEGFGDYWAGSYRHSTPNGATFHPEWAFPWDGHNNCWGGRVMDQTSYQYDPGFTYDAHDFVNGVFSDELWSTPLFQSLVTLKQMGVPQPEVDRIVLQAHFGLGANLRIPEMAQSIVNAAQTLYPNGAHATVFHDKFAVHNISTTITVIPPSTVARTLVYAWVSNNSQFESIVVVNNLGTKTANLTLYAQRSTGAVEEVTRTVKPGGFLSEKASTLFPATGEGSGYSVVVESDSASVLGGWVTNNLDAASGKSPSQGVAAILPESASTSGERVGTKLLFSYLPVTDGLTSAPVIVNLGSANTSVTLRFYNQNGDLIKTDTTSLSSLTPLHPFATVVNNLIPAGSGDIYMTAESSGALITGVGFVFNDFSEPAIGNATSIP